MLHFPRNGPRVALTPPVFVHRRVEARFGERLAPDCEVAIACATPKQALELRKATGTDETLAQPPFLGMKVGRLAVRCIPPDIERIALNGLTFADRVPEPSPS